MLRAKCSRTFGLASMSKKIVLGQGASLATPWVRRTPSRAHGCMGGWHKKISQLKIRTLHVNIALFCAQHGLVYRRDNLETANASKRELINCARQCEEPSERKKHPEAQAQRPAAPPVPRGHAASGRTRSVCTGHGPRPLRLLLVFYGSMRIRPTS